MSLRLLNKLERLKKLRSKLDQTGDRKKPIPDNWLDFARLCDIRSGASIVKFNPYDYQIKLIEQIENHVITDILKTRQLGITEVLGNYMLWKACKNPGYLGAIFSKSQSDTSNIAKRIRRQLDSLSDYCDRTTDSLTDIEITGRGRLLFRNSTPNGARGLESVSDLVFDEAAFIDGIEDIYGSATPSTTVLGDKAKIIVLSTPDTQSGWYWDRINANNANRDVLEICDAIKSESINPVQYWTDEKNNCKFILHWLAHPVFSQTKDTYLEDTKTRLGLTEEQLQREYNLSFTSSDVAVFNPGLVRSQATGEWVSKHDPEGIYYMGLDSSLMGNDYTVLTVLKETEGKFELVDWYRDRKQTHEVNIYRIGELIEKYNPICVGVEVNSAGRIYYDELAKTYLNVDFSEIKTTSTSKAPMVNRLILSMEKDLIRYPNDSKIIEEFLSFRQNGVKLEATEGKHDDIIMSLCFAIAVTPLAW